MTRPVVTRFAPSPTGFLHIGGARTALFNWLFSQHHGGKMLLRIEDTDRARSSDEAVTAILEGLTWMGLNWDGDPVSQFGNVARHQEVANELLASGGAYKCYATAEELEDMREAARAAGKSASYDGRWRDRPETEAPDGAPYVIRIKAPQSGDIIVADQVQGDVTFPAADIDDFVILRSDGTPTYMLAVVVDDHDMDVSHIIRGDDHLTNAARQSVIYSALGWEQPVMAHIPLIHGADGAKLSKRHGALGVEAYRAMGYLPSALRNYLVRLGWSHGDDEVMSTEQMVEWFSLSGINKGASRFDFQKLEALNGIHIRESDDSLLVDSLLENKGYLPHGAIIPDSSDQTRQALIAAMPHLKERAKTLDDLAVGAAFLFATLPLEMEPKAEKILRNGGRDILGQMLPALKALSPWNAASIEAFIRDYAEENELGLGKVAQPLRSALTGKTNSPTIFDVLELVGKDETIARIEQAMIAPE